MNKYFNKAIVGNGTMLGCLDEKGELIRLYYPQIDYYQNIDTYSLGFVKPGERKVFWLKNAEYINQYYDGNIIYTKLRYDGADILLKDYCLIDKNVLVREIKFNEPLHLMVYSKINSNKDKLVSSMCVSNSLVQYCQDFYMTSFSNTKILMSQVNNPREHLEEAKLQLDDYIGMSDESAVLFEAKKEVVLYISLQTTLKEAINQVEFMKVQDERNLFEKTKLYWREFLEKHLNYYIGDKNFSNKEIDIIERTILMYTLLTNKDTGAVLASPDVDEGFSQCGRYGYCWPRDALFINEAMIELGMNEEVNKFYSVWANKTQLTNGLFEQRYYSNGELAPSWGIQIDETSAMIIGISKIKDKSKYINIVKNAVGGLISFLNSNYISKACYDLWEIRKDSHLYSTASIYKALELSREMLKDYEDCSHLVFEIDNLLPMIYSSINEYFVKDGRMVRNISDSNTDISLLGAITPFEVFDAKSNIAVNTVNEIENNLKLPNGGYLRFINDDFIGGNAWIISSLWLALYYIEVGKIDRAKELYDWVTEHQDDKGFLAEQIDKETGKPAWIVGLSWSHALYIIVGKKLK